MITIPILEIVQIVCLVLFYQKKYKAIPHLLIIFNMGINSIAYIIISGESTALGPVLMIALSVVSASLLPSSYVVWGILCSFLGGAFVSSTHYLFHPGTSGITLNSVGFLTSSFVSALFAVILFSQYKKYAINVKLMLAISMLVMAASITVGTIIMLIASNQSVVSKELLIAVEGGMVIGTSVVIAVSAIASIFISRIFTSQLAKLVVVARATVKDGDIEQEIAVDTRDEIGEVAAAFRAMQDYFKEMARVAVQLSEYDLTIQASPRSPKDLFGRAFSSIIHSLNEIIGNIFQAIEQMNNGASQVSQASQTLSQGASEQASSIEEISSSVLEITSQSKQNSENSILVNTIAKESQSLAAKGNEQMQQLLTAMNEITVSAEGIKKIVKTIDDIAFQINLLALNANVEAARAGKYGKGFAVVAEEVRNLANRSAKSVQETAVMVEKAIASIEKGNKMAELTSGQLQQIVAGATKVSTLADEVAHSSREQASGLNQISTGLNQIEMVTQANTASAEETASASQELSSEAVYLKTLVSRFKLRENSGL